MKRLTTLFFTLCLTVWSFAQVDEIYVHVADASNIVSNRTILDHPSLNGNVNAKVVIAHNWSPPNAPGEVYNNKVTGVWYNGSNWTIFNEDQTAMTPGTAYNVYIQGGVSEIITHTCTPANQGSSVIYSVIDHPLLNGNPNPRLAITNKFSAGGGGAGFFNNMNTGLWYDGDDSRWNLYSEDLTTPLNANQSYNIIVQGWGVNVYRHQATVANSAFNYTVIDQADLNGDPNAAFVYSHYWNPPGLVSEVEYDYVTGVWYTGSNWSIYNEDNSTPVTENVVFDLIIPEAVTTGVNDNLTELGYSLDQNFPNPMGEYTDIKFYLPQNEKVTLTIYNLVGQRVAQLIDEEMSAGEHTYRFSADIAGGNYFYELKVKRGTITKKMTIQ